MALGPKIDNLLLDYASFAKLNYSESEFLLITDQPRSYASFPGFIIHYKRSRDTQVTLEHLVKNYGRKLQFGWYGYWFKTFERLLALDNLLIKDIKIRNLLHLENDILSFFDHEIVERLGQEYQKRVAVQQWWKWANAGVLFAPNSNSLGKFLSSANKIARLGRIDESWSIDMPLLRRQVNEEIIEVMPYPVPSVSQSDKLMLSRDLYHDGKRIIADNLDLGTYLFGRNSIYDHGRLHKGFKYDHVAWPIENTTWKLTAKDFHKKNYIFSMHLQSEEFLIPFLHINSKLNLVKSNAELLLKMCPSGLWVKEMNFPLEGIVAPTIHKGRAYRLSNLASWLSSFRKQ